MSLTSKTKTKSVKKKKRSPKPKICKTCGRNIIYNEDRDATRFTNDWHQLRAKEHCDDHEDKYMNHKCRPHWGGDCGVLITYEITLTDYLSKSAKKWNGKKEIDGNQANRN